MIFNCRWKFSWQKPVEFCNEKEKSFCWFFMIACGRKDENVVTCCHMLLTISTSLAMSSNTSGINIKILCPKYMLQAVCVSIKGRQKMYRLYWIKYIFYGNRHQCCSVLLTRDSKFTPESVFRAYAYLEEITHHTPLIQHCWKMKL